MFQNCRFSTDNVLTITITNIDFIYIHRYILAEDLNSDFNGKLSEQGPDFLNMQIDLRVLSVVMFTYVLVSEVVS